MSGTTGHGDSKCFRVLAPLDFVEELMEKSMYHLTGQGCISVAWSSLKNADELGVMFVKRGGVEAFDVTKVNEKQVTFKMFELNMNYSMDMNVIAINTPKTKGLSQKM